MKYFIASDIHGSLEYAERLFKAFEAEEADKILLLGDLLYHGPRNDLPDGYAPKAVIELLNRYKDRILCVRGNCDTEVDQMVLDFPIMAEYAVLTMGDVTVYATHGHVFGEEHPPKLAGGEILLCGHTHVPVCRPKERFVYMNPGSVSIPKEDSWHGYMIWQDKSFVWKDLDGNIKLEYKLD